MASYQDGGSPEVAGDQASFSLREVGECAVVAASGEIDLYTVPVLRETLLAAMASTAHRVVLDLAGVTFLDSMGMGAMVGAMNRAQADGKTMCLVGPAGPVRKVLSITRLDEVFEIYASLESAVEHRTTSA